MLKLFIQTLNGLPSLMGDRVQDFTDKVFGPNRKHMWNQLKDGDWARLSCYDLAKICNVYHIPVANLIQQEGKEIVFANREQIQHSGEWQDIVFTPRNIYNAYQNGKPQLKQFAEAIKTTPSCLYRWFAGGGKCTMTVNQALLMTYNMDLPLSFLFDDKNAAMPSHLRLNTAEGEERTLNEMRELREQLHAKQSQINKLNSENKRLRDTQPIIGVAEEMGEYNTRIRPFIFNQTLWDNLHIVFGMSKRELERTTGVSTLVSKPSVLQVVSVCNALHLSFHHFVMRSVVAPTLQPATYYQDNNANVRFIPDRLNALFQVGNILGKQRKDTLQVLGVSDMMSRRWTREDSTLDVQQFVELCNELDVTPSICIEDNSQAYCLTLTEMLLEENMKLRHLLMMERQKSANGNL